MNLSPGKYLAVFSALRPNARRFLALSFLLAFAQSMFGLVFNLYILKLGYDRDFLGLLGSLPTLAVAALAVPLALACSRMPARKTLLVSLGLTVLSMAGLSAFNGKPALVFFSILSGAASAFFSITAFPLMVRSSSESQRQALFSGQFGISMAAAFAGNLCAGWLTGLGAARFFGGAECAAAYRLNLLAAGGLAAAAAWPAFRIKEDAATAAPGGALAGIKPAHALLVFGPQLIVGFGAGMIMPYLNIFFKSGFDLPIASLGFYMSLMPLSMALGALLGPWLVKKQGRVRTIITFQTLSIPFLATMGFSGLLLPTVLAAFARTMLMNASWPVYSVFMLGNFPAAQHAGASALYSAGWNLANALGARLSGRLQMDFGFTLPFLITIVCYCAATLLLSRKFLRAEINAALRPGPLAAEKPAA
ncbi:MAG TPA: MFS transporter [Elusimicrobiales bacterium]|nr:MFS transporter [Elusimicrobiales bacterium]